MTPVVVSDGEKRHALARVLESRTFGRSDQLRAFLRYVCEAELEGRAHQLNEYALGVWCWGARRATRPAKTPAFAAGPMSCATSFGPTTSQKVRRTPFRSRSKRGRTSRVSRGGRKRCRIAQVPGGADAAAPRPSHRRPSSPQSRNVASCWSPQGPRSSSCCVVRLQGDESADRVREGPSRRVRDARDGGAVETLSRQRRAPADCLRDAPLLLRAGDGARGPGLPDQSAGGGHRVRGAAGFPGTHGASELQERFDYADYGAVHAAFLLGRLLGREVGLKHSNSLGWEDIWNSNIIFLGKPN